MGKRWRTRVLLFLAVLGPGFITANVDNDSGGILTYSQAGAQYGYGLLWTILPITLALIVVQEMCARMGVVTGKGLSDLIREEFGPAPHLCPDGLAGGGQLHQRGHRVHRHRRIAPSLHVSKFISVPLCAALVWYMVVRGSYKSTEKIFWLPRSSISPISLPVSSRSPVGMTPCWPRSGFRPGRSGARRPTCTWPSASWAPPSPPGCSFISSRRLWRREFASRTTRPRASMSSSAASSPTSSPGSLW